MKNKKILMGMLVVCGLASPAISATAVIANTAAELQKAEVRISEVTGLDDRRVLGVTAVEAPAEAVHVSETEALPAVAARPVPGRPVQTLSSTRHAPPPQRC